MAVVGRMAAAQSHVGWRENVAAMPNHSLVRWQTETELRRIGSGPQKQSGEVAAIGALFSG